MKTCIKSIATGLLTGLVILGRVPAAISLRMGLWYTRKA